MLSGCTLYVHEDGSFLKVGGRSVHLPRGRSVAQRVQRYTEELAAGI